MTAPYYQDDLVTLHHGDALGVAETLESESVDCIVTSPPYFGLRDYGQDGQYGLEESPTVYVETMRALFAELRRVLAKDGTLWLNLGDSYSSAGGKTGVGVAARVTNTLKQFDSRTRPAADLPSKNLLGIPWRVAFALQDDGWILRNAIVWHKPNAMPSSVTDRLTNRYEHVFLFSKSPRYHFDLDPIREDLIYPEAADGSRVFGGKNKADSLTTGSSERTTGRAYGAKPDPTNYAPGMNPQSARAVTGKRHDTANPDGKNPGDMWSINTQPFAGSHFAVMPRDLARRAVVAGCKPGGVVLDPFSGSGTTGMVATQEGRKYVGIDLNADYLRLSLETRFAQPVLNMEALA